MFDHGQVVLEGDLAQGMVFGGQERFFPGIADAAGLPGRGAIVSQLMGVDARQQFGAAPNKEHALAQQSAQGPFVCRIHVSRRDQVGAQQVREFLGVDAVVLVLAAMNGFNVERVSQNERQSGFVAGVG